MSTGKLIVLPPRGRGIVQGRMSRGGLSLNHVELLFNATHYSEYIKVTLNHSKQ